MMFSAPNKKAAYLILESVEQLAAFQRTYVPYKGLPISEQARLSRVIESLDRAIQLSSSASKEGTFLTTKALSITVFLEIVLSRTTSTEDRCGDTVVKLMAVLQEPEDALCSSMALCASLESVFWQTVMGAVAAPDARTKSFYTLRLERITTALALKSWHDASLILQRFLWIPSIFSAPCYQILSEILCSQGYTDI